MGTYHDSLYAHLMPTLKGCWSPDPFCKSEPRRHQQRDTDMSNIRPIEAGTAPQFDPANTIIRFPEVEAITGLARATVYKRLKDDPTFPKPVSLSNSKSRGSPVGFVLAEIQTWVRQRIALREVA